MAEVVLDASALIAFLRNEAGAKKVAEVLTTSCISAVTLAEVLRKMAEFGQDLEAVAYHLGRLNIAVVAFDTAQARIAAAVAATMVPVNLSIGAMACLALAIKMSLPAMTADSGLAKVDAGVKIVRIR